MSKLFNFTLLLIIMFLASSCEEQPVQSVHQTFYVGGYTLEEFNASGKGIYTCSLNTESGEMTLENIFENSINPSYITIHPNGKYLYAANEIGDKTPGYVSSFRIKEDGQLEFINEKYTGGDYPCYISITPDEKYLLAANYGGGSVSVFPLLENGEIDNKSSLVKHSGKGPFEERQEAAHAHYFGPGINDSTAFAIDLGTDRIFHYRIKSNGRLSVPSATKVTEGTGPRHLVFHPTLKVCYVILEFTNQIEAFKFNDEYTPFEKIQSIYTVGKPLPFYAATSSAIKIHPSGKYLYAGNRGIPDATEDNIAMFSINPDDGTLFYLGNMDTKGKVPRDFEIDPTGNFLIVANQETNNLVSFKIDQETGKLTPTGFELAIGTATCIKFMRS